MVAKSPPDGYTLLLADIGALAISPSLYKLSFDPATDFSPVTMVATRRTFWSCIHRCGQ
jgi:tripartite-type tricarboxylate transporter receptor subunit TctC